MMSIIQIIKDESNGTKWIEKAMRNWIDKGTKYID